MTDHDTDFPDIDFGEVLHETHNGNPFDFGEEDDYCDERAAEIEDDE